MYPNVPIIPSQLDFIITPNDKTFALKYKPNNCLNGLDTISIRNFPDAPITRIESANPPVTGSFNLLWNSKNFQGFFSFDQFFLIALFLYFFSLEIGANIDDESLKNYLESAKEMGQVSVERSKNCAGYKWRIKWQSGGSKPQITIVILKSF